MFIVVTEQRVVEKEEGEGKAKDSSQNATVANFGKSKFFLLLHSVCKATKTNLSEHFFPSFFWEREKMTAATVSIIFVDIVVFLLLAVVLSCGGGGGGGGGCGGGIILVVVVDGNSLTT